MHHDLEGNIDRWGSKYESFVFPAIILFVSLHWNAHKVYVQEKNNEKVGK